nr:trigger factor [Clostridia bacterium]
MNKLTKYLCLALTAAMMLSAAACSKDNTDYSEDYQPGDRTYTSYNLDDYVVVGQYTGLNIDLGSIEVSDEDVENAINSALFSAAKQVERKDGTVNDGDIVNIDYVGYIDGKAFDGGSDEGFNLTIGSGTMIKGFEESLVGMPVGKTVKIELSFPETYAPNPDLAGMPAAFDVTINYVLDFETPELNDAFVKSVSSAKNVAEYRELIREQILENRRESLSTEKMDAVWLKIRETSEVIKYPEKELTDYRDEFSYYYRKAASEAGMSFDKYMQENYGVSAEQFDVDAESYAYDCVENDLVFRSIVKKAGITIDDDEYAAGLATYFQQYGKQYFDSAEAFEAHYGKDYIVDNLLWFEMLTWLVDNNSFTVAE